MVAAHETVKVAPEGTVDGLLAVADTDRLTMSVIDDPRDGDDIAWLPVKR